MVVTAREAAAQYDMHYTTIQRRLADARIEPAYVQGQSRYYTIAAIDMALSYDRHAALTDDDHCARCTVLIGDAAPYPAREFERVGAVCRYCAEAHPGWEPGQD